VTETAAALVKVSPTLLGPANHPPLDRTDPSCLRCQLGKKMKKNNVAIDVITFGSESDALPVLPSSSISDEAATETNAAKLTALVEAANSSDNSHILEVEPGPYLMSDRIGTSAIVGRGGAGEDGFEGGAGGGDDDGMGFDPNLDPELAMVSLPSLFLPIRSLC